MGLRSDPFAELVRRVAAQPDSAYNLDRYLWVLEEPPPRRCETCGTLFDPWFTYDGRAGHGPARRYCSPRCRGRAAYERQRARLGRACEPPWWELAGSTRSCPVCAATFDPALSYAGTAIHVGRRRTFCSPACQAGAAGHGAQRWGSAA